MKKLIVNICRIMLATTFILSGFVKAVDPLGTQYKIDDYLGAMHLGGMLPGIASLGASVVLAAVEFCLGIFLLTPSCNERIWRYLIRIKNFNLRYQSRTFGIACQGEYR